MKTEIGGRSMSRFCSKCGYEMDETALACPKCGAPTGVKARKTIQEKDLAICVILSIITCGIYAIY